MHIPQKTALRQKKFDCVSSNMSRWKCNNCKLFNSSSIDKCIACFEYNDNKYWKCIKCDLLNLQKSYQCLACFNINKPSFKIGDKWIRKYIYPQSLDPNSITSSQLIEWNNKLYHIMIKVDIKNDFVISIIDIDLENKQVNHQPVDLNSCGD